MATAEAVLAGPAGWALLNAAAFLPMASIWAPALPWTNCPLRNQGELGIPGSGRIPATHRVWSGNSGTTGGRLAANTDHANPFRLGKVALSSVVLS